MRLIDRNRAQSVVKTVRESMTAWGVGLMVGLMAAAPSATPSGMLYQGDPFQLVVKLRTVARLESLTTAQRAEITNAVQHHRNAIRTAPTEELQLAAATDLISDVAGILTPTQRAELARTVDSGSGTPHTGSANP
jgi:Spy/CpxP family protein refolding chaperone